MSPHPIDRSWQDDSFDTKTSKSIFLDIVPLCFGIEICFDIHFLVFLPKVVTDDKVSWDQLTEGNIDGVSSFQWFPVDICDIFDFYKLADAMTGSEDVLTCHENSTAQYLTLLEQKSITDELCC